MWFLRPLLGEVRRRPSVVSWDSGPHHCSEVAQTFLEDRPRLLLHRFLGYTAEINPEERACTHLKNHELARSAPHGLTKLGSELRLGGCGCGTILGWIVRS